MHVYTMGTRAYAEEVCKAIDPDGKFFCGRILSRDESGSERVVLDLPLPLVDKFV
jgi:RNA polymerase II subunit A-like phosphatase